MESVVQQVHRLLQPGGVFVSIEPDYGGLIEFPAEIESQLSVDQWIASRGSGSIHRPQDACSIFKSQNGMCELNFFLEYYPANLDRFRFLEDLPLTADEQSALVQIRKNVAEIPAEHQLVHLPYFLLLAEKRDVEHYPQFSIFHPHLLMVE